MSSNRLRNIANTSQISRGKLDSLGQAFMITIICWLGYYFNYLQVFISLKFVHNALIWAPNAQIWSNLHKYVHNMLHFHALCSILSPKSLILGSKR